jgi:hypothetical protein
MGEKNQQTRPNFLIVGAAKSGTTSLYYYLKQHPDVFVPEWKEPSFFAPPETGGVSTEDGYLALFEKANKEKAIGEASVVYLYAPESPGRIREYFGDSVKIIMLLRNPVDMAYSLWGHNVREGVENLDFKNAIDAEEGRLSDGKAGRLHESWIGNFAYADRAFYTKQIARYDGLFKIENIKIYIFEEFFENGLPLFADLCRFLEIDDGFEPDISTKHNVAGEARSVFFRELIRNPANWKEPIKAVVPEGIRSSVKEKLERLNRRDVKLPEIDRAYRKELEARFDHDVRALERRLQRNLKDVWF